MTTPTMKIFTVIFALILALASAAPSCREPATPCSLDYPEGSCDSGYHCQYGSCMENAANPCSSQDLTGTCDYPDESCHDGSCVSLFDQSCSENNPYGSCPTDEICRLGQCQPLSEIDRLAGLAPERKQRQAIFYQVYQYYQSNFAFTKERNIDWQALFDRYYFAAASASTYREFYRQISTMLSNLADGHSMIQSEQLCNTMTSRGLPAVKYNRSLLGGCGLIIDDRYVLYDVAEGNPLGLKVGDAIVGMGPDTSLNQLYADWQVAPHCFDNSFQFEHHAFLAFQTSLMGMAPWYDQITIERLSGARETLPLSGVPLSESYCFGYPLRHDPRSTASIYTEEISPNVLYFNVLSFHQIPIQYHDFVKQLSGKDGVIIDLRGNMGGYSFSTGGLVAPFLKSDYTFHCFAESIGAQDMVMKADPARDFQGRIAILTNEISKSGADFAAYALLHGNVVGEARSFGTPSAGLFSATQFTDISYTLNESSETLQSGVTIEQCANDDGVNLDGSYVDPDERITFQASDIVSGQDPVINRALAWIDGE